MAEFVVAPTKPMYRGADGGAVLPYREHFRDRWPDATRCVATDLDLVLRLYSPTNQRGAFLLAEFKYLHDNPMTGGQRWTFRSMDMLLTQADPEGNQYRGLYLINWIDDDGFVPVGVTKVVDGWDVVELVEPTLDEFDDYFLTVLDPDRREAS